MYDSKLFSEWVISYEKDIYRLKDLYPFAGYFDIVKFIAEIIESYHKCNLLDLGVGTGLMISVLQKEMAFDYLGCDFSKEMVDFSKKRLKSHNIFQWDIRDAQVSDRITSRQFDIILSAFTFHHFEDAEKLKILQKYVKFLKKGGQFIIADISFDGKNHFGIVKKNTITKWDKEEENGYFISSKFLEMTKSKNWAVSYKKISFCTGIYQIRNGE